MWENKERIKHNILIAPIQQGGLKMIDIQSFLNSIKAKWISRIINSRAAWSEMGKHLIKKFAEDYYLLKIHTSKIKYIDTLPSFYKQILECYLNAISGSHEMPTTPDEFLCQPLWHNKYIVTKIRKKEQTLFISNWIKNGVLYIKDLPFIDGNIDERAIYKHIRNKSNILIEINEVKMALKPYRNLILQISPNSRPINKRYPSQIRWSTKKFYNCEIENKIVEPTYTIVKTNIPNTTDDDIERTLIFKILKRHDNKLAEFSYKIIHNILICGKLISKWTDTSKYCRICKPVKIHDIAHMLYHCSLCKRIWQSINTILNITIELKHIILLYESENNEDMSAINYCITVISFNIYKYWVQVNNLKSNASIQALRAIIIMDLKSRVLVLNSIGNTPEITNKLEKIIIEFPDLK